MRAKAPRIILAGLGLLAVLTLGKEAAATSDGIFYANILYEAPQEENKYCYARVPVYGEIGIPAALEATASLNPFLAKLMVSMPTGHPGATEIDGRYYVNINAISKGAPIVHNYVYDAFNGDVLEYEAELDVTALAAANGDDLLGRQRTITQAKLAMLALAKNLKDSSSSDLYRLKMSFKGLPSQNDLSGEPLYATSAWAYTGASAVLAAYESELLSDWCAGGVGTSQYGFDDDGKADGFDTTSTEANNAPQAGCSIASSSDAGALMSVLMLLAAALVLRRRRE